jgi:hypothetical protein
LSFFDEADEPSPTQVRPSSRSGASRSRAPRQGGGGGRSGGRGGSGSRRRPPSGPNHQSIVARRAVAAVAVVVVIVLIAVGVSSCQSSAHKSALQDYANSVNTLITKSSSTGKALFRTLAGGLNKTAASDQINNERQQAQQQYDQAKALSVPSDARTANARLLLAMQQRLDGITDIAAQIQPALSSSVTQEAVNTIAGEMARFYSSDVLYKDYVAPPLVSALHANHIAVGGADGIAISDRQFLPSLDWLQPSFVASELNVSLPSSGGSSGSGSGKPAKGLHGHSLTSVAVGGTTLDASATTSITASPTPTFDISFDNGGDFNETDVTCKVTVSGQDVHGSTVVPETFAGKSATCSVPLNTSPQQGTASVTVTIAKVPGESNTSNNTQTYSVDFT